MMEEVKELLRESLNGDLYQIVLSGFTDRAAEMQTGLHMPAKRRKVRPILHKSQILFQVCSYVDNQVFHENMTAKQAEEALSADLAAHFQQMQVDCRAFSATVLVSRKGKTTIKKKKQQMKREKEETLLPHNREKNYILKEGIPVPFLMDLGVQTEKGKIVQSRYDKFRQINRFLEFIDDIMPILPKDRQISVIDFGCGKSYLTFAMYYYLHELQGLSLKVTGLDLKKEVVADCNKLAEKYRYDGLRFLHGDIADYTGTEPVDMVVSLHACDTATDYALFWAIKRKARVILAVPCCQHEANRQICSDSLEGALRYGLIRERLAALFTDALRADLLEEQGYDTQVLEFIEMEHTPKNVLLRAVRRDGPVKERDGGSKALSDALHIKITLQRLLREEKGEAD